MTDQGETVDHAEKLRTELHLLYERAGSPLYSSLVGHGNARRPAIGLSPKTLSDWFTGESVPSKPASFAFLIDHLQRLARGRDPKSPVRPADWWEELRSAAQKEKRAGQGRKAARTRPKRDRRARDGDRRPWMAPALDRMIERPELERDLLDALTGAGAAEVALTTGLEGAGGFGKTRLAMWACHRDEIARRYPGGLVWVTVGQDVRGADLALRVNDASYALSGDRPALSSPEAAGAELGRLLDERPPVLLVIDDIWDEPQLSPFRIGGQRCTRLVTTRNPDVLPEVTTRIHVDAMSTDQASHLVTYGLSGMPAELVLDLVRRAGRWPVLLNLINGALRHRAERGQPPRETAEESLRQLVEYGPGAFDLRRPADRSQAVAATVNASLSLLDEDGRECYLDLSIVPEDVDVPLDVLALLWPGQRPDRLCEELLNLGLAADYRLDEGRPRLIVHDVLHAYLRSRRTREQRASVHRRLVDAAAGLLPGGDGSSWWLLPDSADYLWRHLPYHLHEMAEFDRLTTLVGDLRWVEAKTRTLGSVIPVLADLALVSTPITETLRRHLDFAAPLLGPIDPPAALGATLASRLTGVTALESAVGRYRTTLARPRLEPAWPLPDRPDPDEPPPSGHTGGVTDCAFSPDGELLATASDDGTARIWSVLDGSPLRVLTGHAGGLWGCEFSPDGRRLATCSTDRSVRVWDVTTGDQVAVLRGHTDWVRACAFSPDGTLLVTAGADRTVRLWDLTTWTQRAVLTGHRDEVRDCGFSSDGGLAASASADGTVRLWDVGTGAEEAVLTGNKGGAWSCAFSRTGRLLAAASYGKVIVRDLSAATESTVMTGHDEVDDCAFAPDGSLLATTSYGRVQLWSAADGSNKANLTGHTGAVWGCSFSPDGSLLATVSNDQTIRLWRVAEATEHLVIAASSSKTNSCSFSPDGSLLATTSYDSSVRLLSVTDGDEWRLLSGHSSRVISCAFSPDGALLATTSYGEARVWNIGADAEPVVLSGHTDWVRSCAFSPDGSLLATGSADRTTRLWDVTRATELRILARHQSGVRSCAFSPDGSLLATGTADGTVTLWRVADGAEARALLGHTSGVQSCAFSPDGELLATASGDRTVRLWNVEDGTERTTLTGHTSWADRCSFSPDGSLLATASNDQTIRLWDVSTGENHCTLRVGAPLAWVAWHPDGSRLCTVGGAGTYLLGYLP